ncbi:MAG TPA: ATP-binding protein [Chloroflexota bacterium]|nr:ATP-binding protein [Chloroflexota bacterium]
MFGSLRSKLIASYAAVIILCLVLAGSGSAYLLRAYQTQLAINRLADLAVPLTITLRRYERANVPRVDVQQVMKDYANQLDLRILLVDAHGQIVSDTNGTLTGQQLPAPAYRRQHLGIPVFWGSFEPEHEAPLTFVVVGLPMERTAARPILYDYDLVVAVPEQSVTGAWMELAPGLAAAAVLALIISVAVAALLARSIVRPIAQVIHASERMARGDFEQYITVNGHDEVGQLATSFNTMAREVGRMNRAMRDLLANVSHELRTPLTSIEGFAQAMVDGTIRTPEEYADAARIIGEEAARMHRLVEDLLYLSKIESGQITIEQKRLDVPSLLEACVRQVQPIAARAGLAIELRAGDLPAVLADEHRLQQVFVNLLDNAVKHTPAGGRVQVQAYVDGVALASDSPRHGAAHRAGPPWIAVEVHNTGSFIPPEHLQRIFERFYRVEPWRPDDGSGLGLAIVKEIVQAHRGKVSVKSDPSEGTTFIVYLPAA